ncbi:aminoglycoside phosphotransferase family protein [Paenibacillus rhizovicinus]|uniref:Aminoglycoside phosphotransferase family protein n=1 Tax=Paenibacillus rhizovicinus TaxID=2704463 RepID=A0A6C0P603_9BACL|nr:aminoglycoside phosphotransferase family protein [Paenibacillus rhizovicinus]QHW33781.1 aminoglycoside phosphotransferase family protein [Paenibacillus rhizovicinus]
MKDAARLFDFQALNEDMVKRLFATFDPRANITQVSALTKGMSTSNYALWTDSGGKYVLRIYPPNNDHCRIEVAAYRYAKEKLSAPEIFFFDDSKQLVPFSYLIMAFIEGSTLGDFIEGNAGCPDPVIHRIGSSLALLHQTEYPHMALLDEQLQTAEQLEPFESQYYTLLNGQAGSHIEPSTKEKCLQFLTDHAGLVGRIADKHAFSHGDFIFSNIMIRPSLEPCFIDYEYCFAAPVFYDIGKFFRTRTQVERYIGADTVAAFQEGYNREAREPLPEKWYELSKLADISTMLHLINKPRIPDGWGMAIDGEIDRNLELLRAGG